VSALSESPAESVLIFFWLGSSGSVWGTGQSKEVICIGQSRECLQWTAYPWYHFGFMLYRKQKACKVKKSSVFLKDDRRVVSEQGGVSFVSSLHGIQQSWQWPKRFDWKQRFTWNSAKL